MKVRKLLLMLIVISVASVALVSCEKDSDDEQCQVVDLKCEDRVTVIDKATSCCTEDGCYYKYNDVEYTTTSEIVDIIETANPNVCPASGSAQMLKSGMVYSKSLREHLEAQLEEVTQKLLKEAIASADCN